MIDDNTEATTVLRAHQKITGHLLYGYNSTRALVSC